MGLRDTLGEGEVPLLPASPTPNIMHLEGGGALIRKRTQNYKPKISTGLGDKGLEVKRHSKSFPLAGHAIKKWRSWAVI